MRLFSHRKRPAAAGPLPTELLPRRAPGSAGAEGSLPDAPAPRATPGQWAVSHAYGDIVEVFTQCRTADVLAAPAPMPSIAAATDNVRGYCFFLDADLAGICEPSAACWTAQPIEGHRSAVAIVVGTGRPVRRGEPGYGWIYGSEQDNADLRATEIATVLTRYLGTLGYSATAHTAAASDVDRFRVAVEAGVLEAGSGGLGHPFVKRGIAVAAVSTSLELTPDGPLAHRSSLQNLRIALKHALGWGGTRPGWSRLDGRHRPWHLGRFPMERVKRVEEPTTLIIPEEVKRPAARHNFFVRAGAGDLGPRPRTEVARFIRKAPHGIASQEMLRRLVPLQRGEPAAQIGPGVDDPSANTEAVKALGHFIGADMTGVCEAPEYAWYSHRPDGSPIERLHRNAIVFVLDQGFETMEGASGDDWISGAQSMRAYLRASIIANAIAAQIRRLGYDAQAHTAADDEINHIPLLLSAGIGELSRIGELVLNPFVGPRFKSGVITTDMPLTPDRPIDFGLQDFCSKCTKCARECPVGAIRSGDKVMFNGYEMWKPDVDRCARYRITNMRGSACGRCMKTCPYNIEGVLSERPFQWAAMKLPFARSWIARLDDKIGRGEINPAKKWWVDIEVVDDVPVAPPKGANERGLNRERKPRDESGFAMFPPEMAPPGGDGMVPSPLDREAGIAAAQQAERPAAARARTAQRTGQ